MVEFLSI